MSTYKLPSKDYIPLSIPFPLFSQIVSSVVSDLQESIPQNQSYSVEEIPQLLAGRNSKEEIYLAGDLPRSPVYAESKDCSGQWSKIQLGGNAVQSQTPREMLSSLKSQFNEQTNLELQPSELGGLYVFLNFLKENEINKGFLQGGYLRAGQLVSNCIDQLILCTAEDTRAEPIPNNFECALYVKRLNQADSQNKRLQVRNTNAFQKPTPPALADFVYEIFEHDDKIICDLKSAKIHVAPCYYQRLLQAAHCLTHPKYEDLKNTYLLPLQEISGFLLRYELLRSLEPLKIHAEQLCTQTARSTPQSEELKTLVSKLEQIIPQDDKWLADPQNYPLVAQQLVETIRAAAKNPLLQERSTQAILKAVIISLLVVLCLPLGLVVAGIDRRKTGCWFFQTPKTPHIALRQAEERLIDHTKLRPR